MSIELYIVSCIPNYIAHCVSWIQLLITLVPQIEHHGNIRFRGVPGMAFFSSMAFYLSMTFYFSIISGTAALLFVQWYEATLAFLLVHKMQCF